MHLGVDVERSKTYILVISSVIAAVTVPFCGIIGFVGLMIPHIVRRLIGPDHRGLIPMAAVAGGGFVIICDLISRSVSEAVIPLGIITGFLGGGFFLYLIIARGSVS
jgi:iron complex transport system permease protein